MGSSFEGFLLALFFPYFGKWFTLSRTTPHHGREDTGVHARVSVINREGGGSSVSVWFTIVKNKDFNKQLIVC